MPYADVLPREVAPLQQRCLLCGSSDYSPIKEFPDGVLVAQCRSCEMIYTPVRHGAPASLFGGGSLEILRTLYKPIVDGRRRHFRHRNYQDYLSRINRHAPGRRLLDVGCAHGFFPRMAEQRGFQVMAVEPSASRSAFAREVLGLRVLEGCLDEVDLGANEWDVVTFTDALEYLPNPVADLSRVVERLAPGGILFLKVPNGDYFRLRFALERKLGIRLGSGEPFGPSLRVAHYTKSSLRRLVEKLGLQVVEAGTCPPVDSPPWEKLVGLDLEIEPPFYVGLPERLLRNTLHSIGVAEAALSGQNHFSVAIYVIAKRKGREN